MSGDRTRLRHLWIVGLRRSGTTAIWKMFRGLEGFTCYDEPFNPKLAAQLPESHRKGTWDEFIELWNTDRDRFRRTLSTIGLADEVTTGIRDRDLEYLRYLAQTPTIIDFTRLNFKTPALLDAFPEAVVLFLFRSPVAFASSHLINSENRKFLRQRYFRTMFFTGSIGFDSWGLETGFSSPGFAGLVESCGITPRRPLNKMKSAEKLLLFWLTARRHSQNAVEEDKSGRAFIGSYEQIIDGTSDGLVRAMQALGIDADKLMTGHLRSYSLGHRHDDPVWRDLAANAGFTDIEIQNYLRHETR